MQTLFPSILDYLERNMIVSDDDEDEGDDDDDDDDDDASSSASSTYDGVEQLFVQEEEEEGSNADLAKKREEIAAAAKRIAGFKDKVLDLMEQERNRMQDKIRAALDIQVHTAGVIVPIVLLLD